MVALGLSLWGCSLSGDAQDDADPDPPGGKAMTDMPEPGSVELDVLSGSALRLGFGQRAVLELRVSDKDGKPIADANATFALLGRAQGASLASIDGASDADGIVQNTLTAGQAAATFGVRISVPGAYDEIVDIAVSNAGFGTLIVSAPYEGVRTVLNRVVFAQAGVGCGEADRTEGDTMTTLTEPDAKAKFLALPAGVLYAVTAIAEGKDGAVLAQGCLEGVPVKADRELAATVTYSDEPLISTGAFALDAALDGDDPATVLRAALQEAAADLVSADADGNFAPDHAEGRFLLDSLDATLRSEDYADDPDALAMADALASERMNATAGNSPEDLLSTRLADNEEGPLLALPRIGELTADGMHIVSLSVDLAIDAGRPIMPAAWRLLRIEARAEADKAAVAIDLETKVVESEAQLLDGEDTLQLAQAALHAPLGALSSQVLDRVIGSGSAGYADEISTTIGCATFETWLLEQSYGQDGACDTACVRAACDRAVTRMASAAKAVLLSLDDSRPTLTLQGQLDLSDDDGDRMAERMSTDRLWGQWDAESASESGDAVFGPATATAH